MAVLPHAASDNIKKIEKIPITSLFFITASLRNYSLNKETPMIQFIHFIEMKLLMSLTPSLKYLSILSEKHTRNCGQTSKYSFAGWSLYANCPQVPRAV